MAHATRTRSRETSASGARPKLLEKTYSRVSGYGSKSSGVGKVKRTTSSNGSQQTAVDNPPLRSFTGVFRWPEEGCRPQPPAKLTESQERLLAEMMLWFRGKKTYPVSLNPRETKPQEPPSDWEKLRMLTRESMLRYLRATKWDVNAAKKRLVESIAWRREFGVDTIDPSTVEGEAKSGKETVMGYDKSARPLHYMHPHRNNTKESPTQMQFAVWILECCIDLMPPGVEQLALLINFDSKSRNPTSIANAKLMLYILQNHYVERLGVALCINVPWVFKAFWSAIQGFIDPVTKSKCKFDEDIKSEVPVSQLSQDYGGEVDPKYSHDQYWPDLVKLTQERREAMLKRFREQCNSEIGASEWVIRGGNDEQGGPHAQTKDAAAVVEEAEDKSALARTDSAQPVPAPTTRVTDPPQVQEVISAQSSRHAALATSHARVASALSSPLADDNPVINSPSQDPPESFKTPSTVIAENPLDRTFSTLSLGGQTVSLAAVATGSGAATPASPVQSPRKQDEDGAKEHLADESSFSLPSRTNTPLSTSSTRGGKESGETRRVSGLFNSITKRINQESSRKSTDSNSKQKRDSSSASRSGVGSFLNHKSSRAQINILFFAAARDAAGTSSLTIPLTATPLKLSEVSALIHQSKGVKDPSRLMDVIARSNWSVDQVMVDAEDAGKIELKGGEDVAVIPPVSGG